MFRVERAKAIADRLFPSRREIFLRLRKEKERGSARAFPLSGLSAHRLRQAARSAACLFHARRRGTLPFRRAKGKEEKTSVCEEF